MNKPEQIAGPDGWHYLGNGIWTKYFLSTMVHVMIASVNRQLVIVPPGESIPMRRDDKIAAFKGYRRYPDLNSAKAACRLLYGP